MLKAIISDLGGTLVISEDAYVAALLDTFDHYNIPKPKREIIIKYVGITDKDFITNCIPKEYRNLDNIDKCETMFNSIFPMNYLDRFIEVPGVQAILEYLHDKNIRIAIATGWERKKAEIILSSYGWSKLIDELVTKEDFIHPRPSPDIVIAAIKKLGIKNNECLYIDDTVNGVKSGKAAKVKTVAVLSGAQGKDEGMKELLYKIADITIPSVKKLKDIL